MKSPILRTYDKDGIPVSVINETTKDNTIVIWSVSWDGTKPGKRGVSSWLPRWSDAKNIAVKYADKNPLVTQSACGGFAF